MGPSACTSGYREGPISELEGRLPNHLRLEGGCHIGASLGSWLDVTHRFPNDNPSRYSGKGSRVNISRNPGLLIGKTSFVFGTVGRRRSTVPNPGLLRQSQGSRTEQKSVDNELPPCYHFASCSSLATSRSTTWTWALPPSTGMCPYSLRARETCSANLSLTEASSSAVM